MLLHGPAGCGKTSIAHSLEQELPWSVLFFDMKRVLGAANKLRDGGEARALHAELAAAQAAAPCILVIDEVNALAPAEALPGSVEAALALQLADGLQQLRSSTVFALGICREPTAVHASVRRSGRLNYQLAVRAPSADERIAILMRHAAKLLPDMDTQAGAHLHSVLQEVGREAHGLHAAQLAGLCQSAAMAAWRRSGPINSSEHRPTEADWWTALGAARMTALRVLQLPATGIAQPHACPVEPAAASTSSASQPSSADSEELRPAPPSFTETPQQPASDAGAGASPPIRSPPAAQRAARSSSRSSALAALRRMPSGNALFTSLVVPLNAPEAFGHLGITPPRGVLLHGPAGCGKTTLARLVASAAAANFVEVHAAHLISSALGASEAALARLFAAARAAAPCVLFLDGLEALAPPRGADTSTEGTMDRLLSLLLTELDGALTDVEGAPPVVLLGATRCREDLDPSILRPGRLDVHIAVGLPSNEERGVLLQDMLSHTPVRWKAAPAAEAAHAGEASDAPAGDVTLPWLVQLCEGCSVAELSAFCREAAMEALRQQLRVNSQQHGAETTVGAAHFLKAAEMRRASVSMRGDVT